VRQLASAGGSVPSEDSAAADSLRRLLLVEEQARFAGATPVPSNAAVGTPLADARRVLVGLRRQQPWRARLRAVLLPASVLRRRGRSAEAQAQG
jgi:hypothetical protein